VVAADDAGHRESSSSDGANRPVRPWQRDCPGALARIGTA
jgi:hypothetical protein